MYSLFSQYVKDLKQLQNPDSALSKLLKNKRAKNLADYEIKVRLLVNEISEFSFCWWLI
jgi:hypothetical protein